LPDFCRYKIPKWEKYTILPQNIPNVHKIYQKYVKWTECPYNIPTSSIARPSKIYPNLAFWFENKPSGNPANNSEFQAEPGGGLKIALSNQSPLFRNETFLIL
jgi:hypothetical protein